MEEIPRNLFEKVIKRYNEIYNDKKTFEKLKKILVVTTNGEIIFSEVVGYSDIDPKSFKVKYEDNEAEIMLDEVDRLFCGEIKEIKARDLFGFELMQLDKGKHFLIKENTGEISYAYKTDYGKGGYNIEGKEVKPAVVMVRDGYIGRIEIENIKQLFIEK